uniref:Actin-related protein 2/3 complex subunit 4 n=1 Tax=Panagrellus redivivus TaxID=6233 RepID=A0A7E4VVI3_PANRE
MSHAAQPYLLAISRTLNSVLCLETYPNLMGDRGQRPEIEGDGNSGGTFVPLGSVTIARSTAERTVIDYSPNSVRVNICIRKFDDLEKNLVQMVASFMQKRSDELYVMRKKPLPGYDFTFLITVDHLMRLSRRDIVKFILDFISHIDKETNMMRLAVNAHVRQAVQQFIAHYK